MGQRFSNWAATFTAVNGDIRKGRRNKGEGFTILDGDKHMFMIYKSVYVLQGIGSTQPAVLPNITYHLPELVASDREAHHVIRSVSTSREFVQQYQEQIRQAISDASTLAASMPEVVSKKKTNRAPRRRSSNSGSQDQQIKLIPNVEPLGSQPPSRPSSSDSNLRAQPTIIPKPSNDLATPSLKRKLSGLQSSEDLGFRRLSSDYEEEVSGRPPRDPMRHYRSRSSRGAVPFSGRPHDDVAPAQKTLENPNVMTEYRVDDYKSPLSFGVGPFSGRSHDDAALSQETLKKPNVMPGSRVADSKSSLSFGAGFFSARLHDDAAPAQETLEKPSNLPQNRIAYYKNRLADTAESSVAQNQKKELEQALLAKNNAVRDNEAMCTQLADVASFCGQMAAYLDTSRYELQARFSEMAEEADAEADCSEKSHVLRCMLKDLTDFSRQSSEEVKLPSVPSDRFVAGVARDAFSAAYDSNYRGRDKEFYDSLTIHDDWPKKLEEHDAVDGWTEPET